MNNQVDITHFIKFSKPFIDSCKKVFQTMVFAELEAGKPEIKSANVTKGDISSTIGLNGTRTKEGSQTPASYQAILVLSWPMDTYLKVSSAMLMEEMKTFNDNCKDVGGEIVNMIMGNAKRALNPMGYSTSMAIPSMIIGSGHSIVYPNDASVVEIPLTSVHGPMYMEICYSERTET